MNKQLIITISPHFALMLSADRMQARRRQAGCGAEVRAHKGRGKVRWEISSSHPPPYGDGRMWTPRNRDIIRLKRKLNG